MCLAHSRTATLVVGDRRVATEGRAVWRIQAAHQFTRVNTARHAKAPSGANVTLMRASSIESTLHPSAKLTHSSSLETRLGPNSPGMRSLKQSRRTCPPSAVEARRLPTYRVRCSSSITWNNPESITVSNCSPRAPRSRASPTRNRTARPRALALFRAMAIAFGDASMPVASKPLAAASKACSPVPQPTSSVLIFVLIFAVVWGRPVPCWVVERCQQLLVESSFAVHCRPIRRQFTLFETVRFVRSRIPPPGRLAAAPGGEESGQQCGRFCRPDPDGDRYLVVEPGIGAQVVEGAACPRLHVGGPVDQAAQPSGDEGTGAHRTRFQGHHQGHLGQPPRAQCASRVGQRQHLRVRRGVTTLLAFV